MKRLPLLFALLLVGLGGCANDKSVGSSEQLSLLFVQGAQLATLDVAGGTLTLTGASLTITYFSNRPERLAGQMSLASLARDWSRLFGDDPPNAGIQSLGTLNGARPAVVELLEPPRLDASGTVTYRMQPIDVPGSARERVTMREASLFIDGGLAGPQALASGAVANHCSPMDPRCGFVASPDNCSPMDPRCGFAPATPETSCTPWDSVCAAASGSSQAVWCEMDPYKCENLLVVVKQGNGSGTVTSNPSGIDCGSTCQFTFDPNEQVTITAVAAPGSTFAGWSGDNCSGTGPCTMTVGYGTTALTATFNAG